MHQFVENLDSDIRISSDVGNVIELGGEDLGDDLGIGLLSNQNRPAKTNQTNQSSESIFLEPLSEVGMSNLEPLESISFDLPTAKEGDNNFSVHKSNDFFNAQTSSGPSIQLSSSQISPEEERKKKIELLNKLNRLQSKGYSLTKKFTMDNTLEEIQQEYDRLYDAKSLEASLRFQRQCLMGAVTGAEFLNTKFNPFDWELDGWSESVHENIEDFDEVFEELYDKYKSRGNMPPEAKLLMTLVGSGFMFHMSNSFFRSKMSNMDPNDIFRANPQLAKQFAAAAANQAGAGFGNFMGAAMGVPQGMGQNQMGQNQMNQNQMNQNQMNQNQGAGPFYQSSQMNQNQMPQVPQHVASQPQSQQIRREMKGPSGVDDILKTFQEVRAAELEIPSIQIPMNHSLNQPAMQAMSEIPSLTSTPMSSVSQATSVTQRKGGKRKPVENTVTLNL